jgi:hypothetical protein
MANKKVFLTFGGPTPNYRNRAKIVAEQAKQMNWFTSSIGITDEFLRNHPTFWEKHGKFLESNKRGYGYWLWKPFLIKTFLDKLEEGDILVYADAGCTINKGGMSRLLEYNEMLNNCPNNYGILSFQMHQHSEITWTKRELCEFIKTDICELDELYRTSLSYDEILLTGQCIATSVIIKKNAHSVGVINKWYEFACNYILINDNITIEPYIHFKDHRHDQSIYSLLVKKYGSIKIPDETYYVDWSNGINYPILATRIRN